MTVPPTTIIRGLLNSCCGGGLGFAVDGSETHPEITTATPINTTKTKILFINLLVQVGLEPTSAVYQSAVLPLNYRTVNYIQDVS